MSTKRGTIFKRAVVNENLYDVSNDNGNTAQQFGTHKICQKYKDPKS
jgi:hypothetical protein